VGTCACAFGYSGTACEKSARSVSSVTYYGSILLALIAPAVALLPAMCVLVCLCVCVFVYVCM